MEKLNNLVELATKATVDEWTTDARNAVIALDDQANSGFVICAASGCDKASNAAFIAAANPKTILAIAEAFRELEQRAIAALAEAQHQLNVNILISKYHQQVVNERDALKQRLEAAEQQATDPDSWWVRSAPGQSLEIIESPKCPPDSADDCASQFFAVYQQPPAPAAPIYGDVMSCRECGSKSLTWHAAVKKNTAVQDGRLKLNEISAFFYLGCDECSETLAHISADEIAERISKRPAAPPQIDRGTVREIFMQNGFTIKDGQSDLRDYVYAAAYDLLALAGHQLKGE